MSQHQLEVSVDEAQPGMTLADDLFDDEGQMLLPRGTVLTDTLLASIRKRDIEMIVIAGTTKTPQEELVEHEQMRLRVLHLFRKLRPEKLADQALFELVIKFRQGEQP